MSTASPKRSWYALCAAGLATVLAACSPAASDPMRSRQGVSISSTYRHSAASRALAPTPVLGFDDWNAFGCNVSARLIRQTARVFVTSGLERDGYSYIDIDDCWMARHRRDGHLVANRAKFPHGIAPLAGYVHSLGLKLGIYESAGRWTCAHFPGSLGHEATDAADFARWGVDLLKYDNCGTSTSNSSTRREYVRRYAAMARALWATGRQIVYTVCEWGIFRPWTWAGRFAEQWRTTRDIRDSFASMLAILRRNAHLARFARPGAFNDADMLEVGNGGMTGVEDRSEFSLWAEMASPLIIGTDLRAASPRTLAIYRNRAVIAVDQDRLGVQGRLIVHAHGAWVFAKPLANGGVAVALFNSTAESQRITTSTTAIDAPRASRYRLTNLWTDRARTTRRVISAEVGSHATVVYRVHA